MTTQENQPASGLSYAVAAYSTWGLLPLYFYFILHVPAIEMVAWRIIFTLPICALILTVRNRWKQVWQGASNPRALALLAASAFLIGGNWLVFVQAVQSGHVLATSLGYYINPLVNVLFGTLFLHEKLTKAQWIAVILAGIGVSILAWGALDTLWISLVLAITFSSYGLIRKVVSVEPLPGLTLETIILQPICIGAILWLAVSPQGLEMGQDTSISLLIALSGLLTAIPMLLFATAARRMDYSTLGFIQFLAPTITFIISLTVYQEELRMAQLICFLFIWVAIALFSWDLFTRKRKARRAATMPQ